MIFWTLEVLLDCVAIYFPLLQLEVCLNGRTVSAVCFSLSAKNRRADSNPVQPTVDMVIYVENINPIVYPANSN